MAKAAPNYPQLTEGMYTYKYLGDHVSRKNRLSFYVLTIANAERI